MRPLLFVYLNVMYLGIDVGGTKTLVACLNEHGTVEQQFKFPTPQDYDEFLKELKQCLAGLPAKDYKACGIGIPAVIDLEHGIGVHFAHLKWHNVPIQADIEKLANCPVALQNDAKLAGLAESMLLKDRRVLYVTVSTGIGIAYIVDQFIDHDMASAEGGQILLEHQGKYQRWEDFAAGSAIYKKYQKPVSEINDVAILREIARNIAIGLIDLIAVLTPDVVVIGGSVGSHFDKYGHFLELYLQKYDNPMIHLPRIQAAAHPEEAVINGCYYYAKQLYG